MGLRLTYCYDIHGHLQEVAHLKNTHLHQCLDCYFLNHNKDTPCSNLKMLNENKK